MKSIYLSCIKFGTSFEAAKGSYYDCVAELYASNRETDSSIRKELFEKGWKKVGNGITAVYLKDRHIIRVTRLFRFTL